MWTAFLRCTFSVSNKCYLWQWWLALGSQRYLCPGNDAGAAFSALPVAVVAGAVFSALQVPQAAVACRHCVLSAISALWQQRRRLCSQHLQRPLLIRPSREEPQESRDKLAFPVSHARVGKSSEVGPAWECHGYHSHGHWSWEQVPTLPLTPPLNCHLSTTISQLPSFNCHLSIATSQLPPLNFHLWMIALLPPTIATS